MKKICYVILVLLMMSVAAGAITSDEMLNRVKKLEAGFDNFSANIKISGDPNTIKDQGDRYEDVLEIKDGTIKYKKHNMIRVEGKYQGIKAVSVQNGYWIKRQGGIITVKRDNKNDPGKRQNSLDTGMLSSILWKDNTVTIMSENDGVAKVKFDPIYGGNEKRCDIVWINVNTLKLVKRERYDYQGKLKNWFEFKEYVELTPGYYMSTKFTGYDSKNKYLGTTSYSKLKVNQKMDDSLFKI